MLLGQHYWTLRPTSEFHCGCVSILNSEGNLKCCRNRIDSLHGAPDTFCLKSLVFWSHMPGKFRAKADTLQMRTHCCLQPTLRCQRTNDPVLSMQAHLHSGKPYTQRQAALQYDGDPACQEARSPGQHRSHFSPGISATSQVWPHLSFFPSRQRVWSTYQDCKEQGGKGPIGATLRPRVTSTTLSSMVEEKSGCRVSRAGRGSKQRQQGRRRLPEGLQTSTAEAEGTGASGKGGGHVLTAVG